MNYRGARIVQTHSQVINTQTGEIRWTPKRFEVTSKSFGRCGHKHKKERAALPCLKRMLRQFSELRSQKSKEFHENRKRERIMARDYDPSTCIGQEILNAIQNRLHAS